jgi:predicted DNA binding CopG/RHH family protein
MDLVTQWDAIPRFASDHDEAQYWQSHRLDVALIQASVVPSGEGESTSITLRIDPRMLARIKRIARSRYLNYQSMMKQWLSERLEQELRARGER